MRRSIRMVSSFLFLQKPVCPRNALCPETRLLNRESACLAKATPTAHQYRHARTRFHPSIAITSRSQPIPKCSLNICASSPTVIPGRVGSANCPTNEAYSGSRIFPAILTPLIDSDDRKRSPSSQTPCCSHAVGKRVNKCVDAAADVLHVETSTSTSCSIASVGSRVSLYNEWTGRPVLRSML